MIINFLTNQILCIYSTFVLINENGLKKYLILYVLICEK